MNQPPGEASPNADPPPPTVGRFAPSTTGPAHPGTLLAALLCWLDARAAGGRVVLRLEDLDPERCRPEHAESMQRDLAWLGLDWDAVELQSQACARHERALDALESLGRLYPCRCTRGTLRESARRAEDGSLVYPGTCRERPLPKAGWRACDDPLRVRLPEGHIEIRDESGLDLSADPVLEAGDPVVRRRDGAMAYHLASVVDDASAGVTRVVRGRDLAPSTLTQVALGGLLGLPRPAYRHHLLLLERRGGKLAKLHGAVSAAQLRPAMDGPGLCGVLAQAAGLVRSPEPTAARDLVRHFEWARVASQDRGVRVEAGRLVLD